MTNWDETPSNDDELSRPEGMPEWLDLPVGTEQAPEPVDDGVGHLEFMSALDVVTSQLHEVYLSLQRAGFTPGEGIELVSSLMITALTAPSGQMLNLEDDGEDDDNDDFFN